MPILNINWTKINHVASDKAGTKTLDPCIIVKHPKEQYHIKTTPNFNTSQTEQEFKLVKTIESIAHNATFTKIRNI